MKKIIALFGSFAALAVGLALSVGTTGCSTTSGSNTNILTNPIIGTNGILTTAVDSGISLGSAFEISQVLARSPQHAPQIKADLGLILAALQALQGSPGGVTAQQVATAISGLKLTSAEAQLLVPQFTTLLNDALSTLAAQGVNTVPYMPKLLNALIVGIQSGIGLSPSLPSTAFVPNQSPVLGQPQLEAERIVSVK